MKFSWCTIMVKNMEESLKFYQEIVELPINRRFQANPDMEFCFLGDGETELELVCDRKATVKNQEDTFSLGFEVDSLERMIDFIKEKGLELAAGPFQPNPQVKFFFVRDPNNIKVQFIEHM